MKKKHQESYEKARRKRGKKVTIIKTNIIVVYTEKAKKQRKSYCLPIPYMLQESVKATKKEQVL